MTEPCFPESSYDPITRTEFTLGGHIILHGMIVEPCPEDNVILRYPQSHKIQKEQQNFIPKD